MVKDLNRYLKIFIILISGFLILTGQAMSQDSIDYSNQKDLKDVLKGIFGKKSKLQDSLKISDNKKDIRKLHVSILPGISYNPATDFIIGMSASFSWFLGNPENTSNSAISSGISYTTKNQFKLSIQSNIFTNKNDWNFQGDLRFWKYVQDTYGLGTGTLPADKQDMDFNLIRINQNVLKKVVKNFYAGLGYSLEYYFKIRTIDDDDNPVYPNINNTYSREHGIDSTKYFSSGVVLNLNYDSRDNTINAYKGIMIDMKYYNYNKAIGSSSNWQSYSYELRTYKSLTKNNTYRVALWLWGTLILNGEVPYMSLASTGWDKYNAMGRGYIQGRFRGRDFLYADFENRFDISSNGLFGLVVFVNATTASDPDHNVKLFDYIEPAAGVGLRIKFDKYARTNLSFDYGIGTHGSRGLFITIGEFF